MNWMAFASGRAITDMTPCSTTHPFAVWEHTPTGRILRTFPDSDLAAQFCIQNGGGEVIPNPINH